MCVTGYANVFVFFSGKYLTVSKQMVGKQMKHKKKEKKQISCSN